MNRTLFSILLIGMLLVFSSTAIAYEGEEHEKGMYEEGSGGSSMEMGSKSRAMAHEYNEGQNVGMEHSKEYYEKAFMIDSDNSKNIMKRSTANTSMTNKG